MNDAALDRELERALAVEPSPAFVARVRTRIVEEPSPSSRPFGWLFAAMAVGAAAAAAVVVTVWIGPRHGGSLEAPLVASRSLGSSIVVPTVDPIGIGHDANVVRHDARPVVRTARVVSHAAAASLFDAHETTALQRLIANVRSARVDLTPLVRDGGRQPMQLEPIEDLVIPTITIEPLHPGGVEGERQ